MRSIFIVLASLFANLSLAGCSNASDAEGGAQNMVEEGDYKPDATRVALAKPPAEVLMADVELNARRGRILFVTKGCVLCHAANSVGGKAAPAFDATEDRREINPFAFSARMWRGAAAMVSLQRLELGYQIDMDSQDLADLAAFAASADEQALLTMESLPTGYANWFVDGRFWDNEEWGEYMERGEAIPDASHFDQP